jgi:hypothetical protein
MSCTADEFYRLTYYATVIVNPCGITLSLICVVCISQILLHKSESHMTKTSNVFRYLLVKAMCDLIFFCIDMFHVMVINSDLLSSLIYNFWIAYFYYPVEPTLLMMSALMELMAAIGIV